MRVPSTLSILAVAVLARFHFVQGSSGSSANDPKAKQGMSSMIPGNSVWYPYSQPQAFGFLPPQSVYPGFPDYFDYYQYPPASSKPKGKSNGFFVLLLLIFNLLNAKTDITPSSTPTETSPVTTTIVLGNCQWYPWSSCSKPCRGTRYRTRMCNAKTQQDTEICNTPRGFLPDGKWFRASNCYDYLWVNAEVNYQDAVTACTELGARLASTGMRDDYVRKEVFTYADQIPRGDPLPTGTYIGVSDQSVLGVYEWSDGYVGYPTFWFSDEPDDDSHRCCSMGDRSPWSLRDGPCSQGLNYLCERVAQ